MRFTSCPNIEVRCEDCTVEPRLINTMRDLAWDYTYSSCTNTKEKYVFHSHFNIQVLKYKGHKVHKHGGIPRNLSPKTKDIQNEYDESKISKDQDGMLDVALMHSLMPGERTLLYSIGTPLSSLLCLLRILWDLLTFRLCVVTCGVIYTPRRESQQHVEQEISNA